MAASPETATADRELTLTRVLDAPRQLVFNAWTEPQHLVRWWGPKGFRMTSCELDPRPGGAFRFSMAGPDGKEYPHQGAYREVVAPERLAFTWAWLQEDGRPGHETLITIAFAEEDGKTKLTFHQAVFETVESRDGHEGGWSEAFDCLEDYLAEAAR